MKTFTHYNKNATVDVYVITYNEEYIISEFIHHYYKNFKAQITVFDNQSTDNTVKIAKEMGCTVRSFDTSNEINDHAYLQIKNNAWKSSKANFAIVVDADEFLEVNFDCKNYSIINVLGYDVIGDLSSRVGVANPAYNKACFFRPSAIKEMNYTPGCHNCNPVGEISGSKEFGTLLHRKYISEECVYKKHLEYSKRLSSFNRQYGFGKEYDEVSDEWIKEKFKQLIEKSIFIP